MRNCWGCGKPIEAEGSTYRCDECQEKFESGVAKYNKKVDEGKVKPYFWIGKSAPAPTFTVILIFVNLIMIVMMYMNGYAEDPIGTALTFGAQYTYYVMEYGEWWRLATSWFVHYGVRHFAMNMFSLWIIGSSVEGEFGSVTFALAYVLCGVGSSVATLYFGSEFAVSAGASGAISGIFGFAFMFAHIRRVFVGRMDSRSLLIWIIITQGYGFIVPNVGWIAHLGGLVTGLFLGFIAAKMRPRLR
jgi:rhomboid protease GluP